MKNAFLRYLRANPGLQMRLSGLNRLFGRTKPPAFSGWGMTSESSPPWVSGKTDVDRAFATAAKDLWQQIEEEKFVPSQFLQQPDLEGWMMQLMWRHYFVFWSASFAAGSCVPEKELRLAECGVCDGVTTFFACRAVCHRPHWKFFLYDAWESMRTDQILPSELDLKGAYSYLSIENTRRNLNDFGDNLRFIKGYLPESLLDSREHGVIQWLHIDLNSAAATETTLDQMYPSVAASGIVLFDDYGVPGYADTRAAVDRFFSGKDGTLLPVPTGQALFFKRS